MTCTENLYFVSSSFTSGAGAVKVIDADGSNEITLVEGKEVIEPDGGAKSIRLAASSISRAGTPTISNAPIWMAAMPRSLSGTRSIRSIWHSISTTESTGTCSAVLHPPQVVRQQAMDPLARLI